MFGKDSARQWIKETHSRSHEVERRANC